MPEANPYDAPQEHQKFDLPLRTRIVAVILGLFVFAGAGITMGIFLFATLVVSAGKMQPSPIEWKTLLESPSQRLILVFGGIFVVLSAGALAGWVFFRILKSQRMTAEVLFRRRELQAAVSKLHAAVMEKP